MAGHFEVTFHGQNVAESHPLFVGYVYTLYHITKIEFFLEIQRRPA